MLTYLPLIISKKKKKNFEEFNFYLLIFFNKMSKSDYVTYIWNRTLVLVIEG